MDTPPSRELGMEIANALPHAWLVFDAKGRLLSWNAQFEAIFPTVAPRLCLSLSVQTVLVWCAQLEVGNESEKQQKVRCRWQHFQQGIPYQETRYYSPNRVIEAQLRLLSQGNRLIAFTDLSTFRDNEFALKVANQDLEDRVARRTQALSEAHNAAVKQAQLKGRFLAAISHDLLQPLNAARLFTASLRVQLEKENTIELTDHITQSLFAAEELIGDLLDVSRLESGKLATQVRAFCLSEVLDPLKHEFDVLARDKGIHFRVRSSDLIGISDPKLLRRALQNFLSNAFRYNPKGKVLLGVRRQGQSLRIEVWDNGEGIAEAKQAQIFNEFTRLESDVMEGGLGLGLAIAKGICRVLDHDLILKSWQQQGSVFAIVLPLGVARGVCPVTPPHSLGGISLLCVAKEAVWTKNLQRWGSEWGANVSVQSPETISPAALVALKPSVLFLDQKSVPRKMQSKAIQWAKEQGHFVVVVGGESTVSSSSALHWTLPLKPLKVRLWLQQHVTI